MKRLILVCLMILCMAPMNGWAEGTEPTQPPAPPPPMPMTTPQSIGLDESTSGYDGSCPTVVNGYVFVSFAGESLMQDGVFSANTLLLRVVCRYFEEVYPGCTLEQLKDFVIIPDNYKRSMSRRFSESVGDGREYGFHAMRFEHPYVYGASFEVLLNLGHSCAYFTEPDSYMADRLAQYQRANIRYNDAVDLAWEEFAALQEAARDPSTDANAHSDYLISANFLVSYNESTTYWSIIFYEQQALYNDEKIEESIVFEAEFDAYTGETVHAQLFPNTIHREFLRVIDEEIALQK